jgi:hypothetical protein
MAIGARLQLLVGNAWKDRAMKACFFLAAAFLLMNWLLYAWKLSAFIGKAEPIPVHYSILVGIDKLLPWYWTLISPVLATGAFFLDGFLVLRLWNRPQRPLAILLGSWTAFLLGLFFVSTFLIVLLNVGV